jgi:hypothetical protein
VLAKMPRFDMNGHSFRLIKPIVNGATFEMML